MYIIIIFPACGYNRIPRGGRTGNKVLFQLYKIHTYIYYVLRSLSCKCVCGVCECYQKTGTESKHRYNFISLLHINIIIYYSFYVLLFIAAIITRYSIITYIHTYIYLCIKWSNYVPIIYIYLYNSHILCTYIIPSAFQPTDQSVGSTTTYWNTKNYTCFVRLSFKRNIKRYLPICCTRGPRQNDLN